MLVLPSQLRRVLIATGRYNLSQLARRLAGTRHHSDNPESVRRQLIRWLNGHTTPHGIDQVEELARAARVDLAFLYPDLDEHVPAHTDRGRAVAGAGR